MTRPLSVLAPDWWDYTTLDKDLGDSAARLTAEDLLGLSRPGFEVVFYDTLESFYLAEALEYIEAWRQATEGDPTGVCGPVGPTEHLPLVAQLVDALELGLRHAHFWGMDEWYLNGKEVPIDHKLSFERADRELCFDRIRPDLRMPEDNLHFPRADNLRDYSASFEPVRCVVMQGGQGDVNHWAFNDPPKRQGPYTDEPPPPEEYLRLGARLVDLHPMTISQNARASAGGRASDVPAQALTVGPQETWKAERVSIWHTGRSKNAFTTRLTTLMISERIVDTAVPISLLGLHPNVRFSFYRHGIGTCAAAVH